MLGIVALRACANGRFVGEHVRPDASNLQLLQYLQRMLWLLIPLACADARVAGDHVLPEATELQLHSIRSACGDSWPFSQALMATL